MVSASSATAPSTSFRTHSENTADEVFYPDRAARPPGEETFSTQVEHLVKDRLPKYGTGIGCIITSAIAATLSLIGIQFSSEGSAFKWVSIISLIASPILLILGCVSIGHASRNKPSKVDTDDLLVWDIGDRNIVNSAYSAYAFLYRNEHGNCVLNYPNSRNDSIAILSKNETFRDKYVVELFESRKEVLSKLAEQRVFYNDRSRHAYVVRDLTIDGKNIPLDKLVEEQLLLTALIYTTSNLLDGNLCNNVKMSSPGVSEITLHYRDDDGNEKTHDIKLCATPSFELPKEYKLVKNDKFDIKSLLKGYDFIDMKDCSTTPIAVINGSKITISGDTSIEVTYKDKKTNAEYTGIIQLKATDTRELPDYLQIVVNQPVDLISILRTLKSNNFEKVVEKDRKPPSPLSIFSDRLVVAKALVNEMEGSHDEPGYIYNNVKIMSVLEACEAFRNETTPSKALTEEQLNRRIRLDSDFPSSIADAAVIKFMTTRNYLVALSQMIDKVHSAYSATDTEVLREASLIRSALILGLGLKGESLQDINDQLMLIKGQKANPKATPPVDATGLEKMIIDIEDERAKFEGMVQKIVGTRPQASPTACSKYTGILQYPDPREIFKVSA